MKIKYIKKILSGVTLSLLSTISVLPLKAETDVATTTQAQPASSPVEVPVTLGKVAATQNLVQTTGDGAIRVTTDNNTSASYQLASQRFPVKAGETVRVPYEIIVEVGGRMSLGLLNTARKGWLGPELILEAGTHKGVYEQVVPAGQTEASLVFRNYHLTTAGQSTFTIKSAKVEKKPVAALPADEPRPPSAPAASTATVPVTLDKVGATQNTVTKSPDGTITVTTDNNASANYQLESQRFPVKGGETVRVPYDITVQAGSKMSLGLLNTTRRGWYGKELVLGPGAHKGVYEQVVPEGQTVASLVFRNYHLGTGGQSIFTVKSAKVEIRTAHAASPTDALALASAAAKLKADQEAAEAQKKAVAEKKKADYEKKRITDRPTIDLALQQAAANKAADQLAHQAVHQAFITAGFKKKMVPVDVVDIRAHFDMVRKGAHDLVAAGIVLQALSLPTSEQVRVALATPQVRGALETLHIAAEVNGATRSRILPFNPVELGHRIQREEASLAAGLIEFQTKQPAVQVLTTTLKTAAEAEKKRLADLAAPKPAVTPAPKSVATATPAVTAAPPPVQPVPPTSPFAEALKTKPVIDALKQLRITTALTPANFEQILRPFQTRVASLQTKQGLKPYIPIVKAAISKPSPAEILLALSAPNVRVALRALDMAADTEEEIFPVYDLGYGAKRARTEQYGLNLPATVVFHPYNPQDDSSAKGYNSPAFTLNIKFEGNCSEFWPADLNRALDILRVNHIAAQLAAIQPGPMASVDDMQLRQAALLTAKQALGLAGQPDELLAVFQTLNVSQALQRLNISPLRIEQYMVFQDMPWQDDVPMAVKPQPWLDPDMPYQQAGYAKSFAVHTGLFSKDPNGPLIRTQRRGELMEQKGLTPHTDAGAGNMIVSSGDVLHIEGLNRAHSQAVCSLTQYGDRIALVKHACWVSDDQRVMQGVLMGTNTPQELQTRIKLNANKNRLSPQGQAMLDELDLPAGAY